MLRKHRCLHLLSWLKINMFALTAKNNLALQEFNVARLVLIFISQGIYKTSSPLHHFSIFFSTFYTIQSSQEERTYLIILCINHSTLSHIFIALDKLVQKQQNNVFFWM